jgi:heparan-alpha-glucosaminide N-acetyltransferase
MSPAPIDRPRARVRSVDALRGLVVALMIFVNTVAEVPGVPAFTQHLPESIDGYSLADMILPWFLFLVGVSLPLALGHFVARGQRLTALGRVLPRVAGLALLGVIFVNSERIAPQAALSENAWFLLTVTAMLILLVSRAPAPAARDASNLALDEARAGSAAAAQRRWARLARAIKIGVAVALVILLASYRGRSRDGGGVTWLQPQWWGILGIIGWSYLLGALAYLATGGAIGPLAALLGTAVAFAIGSAHGRSGFLGSLQGMFRVHDFFGSYACLVVAGTIAGVILVGRTAGAVGGAPADTAARTPKLAALGTVLWLAGWLLRPLHGYHKLGSTESWALVAAGQAALMLAAFHAWLDGGRAGHRVGGLDFLERAAQWLADAGSNALLAYLLSELQPVLFDRFGVSVIEPAIGISAMVRAALLTLVFIALAAAATRARVRVRL